MLTRPGGAPVVWPSTEVAAWLLDIAEAVAKAAKDVQPEEQAAVDQITALFAVEG